MTDTTGNRTDADYDVRPLDDSTWPLFAELVERTGGMVAGCFCMAFHPQGSGKGGQGAVNRDRKASLVRSGHAHAALVLRQNRCVGWCQFGPADELPRIKSRAAYDKGLTTEPHWRIGCCYVGKGHRRQGVAAVALAGALTLIARMGGGVVEGYPENADSVPAGFLFNGALSTYEQAGFVRDRQIGKHRWVMTLVVAPDSDAPPTGG